MLKYVKLNPFHNYKEANHKLENINVLDLSQNPYLSSVSCKVHLLKALDHGFQIYRLYTPEEFLISKHFNIYDDKYADLLPEAWKNHDIGSINH